MELGLDGKAFLVTAGSSGLGRATARALVAERARVTLLARGADKLADAAAEFGESATTVVGDLGVIDDAERAVAKTVEAWGHIDGALVSVGGPVKGGVVDNTDEQWRESFETVFLGALRVARAVLGHNPAARLGFVLSSSAKSPLPQMAISNGLRPGLGVLIKQLADEIGPDGGRAFGLLPGTIFTERITYLYSQTPDPEAARTEAEKTIPLRRLGDPDEFGRVAAFLLSDAASYVTGSLIPVDGGVMRTL